ncbi:MAG: PqqD family protein [Acidobacteria bacterium]|nr:PqqD family protein [Acidobacteriota bacterium]
MNKPQNPVARKTGLVVQDVPEEVLVYDTDTNKAHCLNKTAAMIWRSCDGTRSVAEIAKHVGSLAGEAVTDDFVWLAIDQLNESDLLEKQVAADFKGLSRRDVIKRIGLGSMIALPVIASLVAPPTARAAASCNCNNNAECGVGTPNVGCPAPTCNGSGRCEA